MSYSGNRNHYSENNFGQKLLNFFKQVGVVLGLTGKFTYKLRSLVMAIPVFICAGALAIRNARQLPELVGVNITASGDDNYMSCADVLLKEGNVSLAGKPAVAGFAYCAFVNQHIIRIKRGLLSNPLLFVDLFKKFIHCVCDGNSAGLLHFLHAAISPRYTDGGDVVCVCAQNIKFRIAYHKNVFRRSDST